MSRPRKPQPNLVTLHVYDFRAPVLNDVLRQLGTGAFHAAVEVYGREWTFGNVSREGSGIFWNGPRANTAHTYREAVPMGTTQLTRQQIDRLLCVLKAKWPAESYDLVKRNCCHFCNEFCKKLGVGAVPPWVMSLAAVGAAAREDLNAGKMALDKVGLALIGGAQEERRGRGGYEAVRTDADSPPTSSNSADGILCMRPWKMCVLLLAVVAGLLCIGVVASRHAPSQTSEGAEIQTALAPEAVVPTTWASSTAFDCRNSDQPVAENTRAWCCSTQGLWCVYTQTSTTTAAAEYDCSWQKVQAWSDEKRDWCCRHDKASCATTVLPPSPAPTPATGGAQPTNSTAAHPGSPSPTAASIQEYDCHGSSDTWSTDQVKFCCVYLGVGCSDSDAAAYGWSAEALASEAHGAPHQNQSKKHSKHQSRPASGGEDGGVNASRRSTQRRLRRQRPARPSRGTRADPSRAPA